MSRGMRVIGLTGARSKRGKRFPVFGTEATLATERTSEQAEDLAAKPTSDLLLHLAARAAVAFSGMPNNRL